MIDSLSSVALRIGCVRDFSTFFGFVRGPGRTLCLLQLLGFSQTRPNFVPPSDAGFSQNTSGLGASFSCPDHPEPLHVMFSLHV